MSRIFRKDKNSSSSDEETSKSSATDDIKVLVSLIAALIAIFILTGFFVRHFGVVNSTERIPLKDINIEIVHKDGTVEHFKGEYHKQLLLTDKMIVHIGIPAIEHSTGKAMCFWYYNSLLTVKSQGRELLRSGYKTIKQGKMIGHRMVIVHVPDHSYGKELTVTIIPLEAHSTSRFVTPYLLPDLKAFIFPVMNNQFDSILFLVIFFVSAAATIGFAIFSISAKNYTGVFLSLFISATCLWYMGYKGIIYLLSDNLFICSNIEYIALSAMPGLFALYIQSEFQEKWKKILFRVIGLIFMSVFFIELILTFFGIFVYTKYLRVFQASLFSVLILTIILLLTRTRKAEQLPDKIMRYGTVVTLFFGMLELIRILMNGLSSDVSRMPLVQNFISMDFAQYIIIILINVLIISYFMRILNISRQSILHNELKKIAFTDSLTGIPNRNRFEQMCDEYSSHCKGYGVMFVDADRLKHTNDTYGHTAGDNLLITVAKSLSEAMDGIDGFFGRYGGDEFIAVVRDEKKLNYVSSRFSAILDKTAADGHFQFSISASVGTAGYSEVYDNSSRDTVVSDVIRLADQRMYENKIRRKMARLQ